MKKLKVFCQLKMAKLPYIIRACQEFIKGFVISVRSHTRALAGIIVPSVAGRGAIRGSPKQGRRAGKLGGKRRKGAGMLSAGFAERKGGGTLTRLRRAVISFVVKSVQMFLMLRDCLKKEKGKGILCMGRFPGIILMENGFINMRLENGESIQRK